jgi:phosphoribosylanthranilate isomerase
MAEVKICGITDEEALDAAVSGGASYIGMVFFAKSPRFITPERAAELLDGLPEDICRVGLFVDPSDSDLEIALSQVRLDLIQTHGVTSPERVEAIRNEFAMPVMTALSVESAADINAARRFEEVADRLLFDAKPPKGSDRPGGNAVSFDWSLLRGQKFAVPWMLAGGLTPENVAEAIRISGAGAVDVSSGVESIPGVKSPEKICAFLAAAGAKKRRA